MRRKRKAAAAEVVENEEKTVKEEKLPKGVKKLNPKTMLPIIFRVKSIPEQRLRDKIAHDRGLIVGKSYLDTEHERFVFEVVKGIELVPQIVTFKEACQMFGWKSFSFTENKQTVIPVWCDKGADEA